MTLPSSVQHLIDEIESSDNLTPSTLANLLKQSEVTIEDLSPWSDYHHPKKDSYGRKLVYKSDKYEMMVMSWQPGDFSAIHDHGYTQWGAVKIFGPAEHATFRVDDNKISTLARWDVTPGDVVGVNHSLIHQMGNPTDTPFISFHVYGCTESHENITGEARLYDLSDHKIQRVNGGVFFNLKENEIERLENGPSPDFPTKLRHEVEAINRGLEAGENVSSLIKNCFSVDKVKELLAFVDSITDATTGKVTNSIQWKILKYELKAAAKLQEKLSTGIDGNDKFHKYAEVYDEVVGKTSLTSFISGYLDHFFTGIDDKKSKELLSIGCGTGLTEEYIIENYDIVYDNLYGIDISPAMVAEAKNRIKADIGDVLTLDPGIKKWDLAYSGLNVFQYLPCDKLESAIQATAEIVNAGGCFIGDFITPDHIRWYPNVFVSGDQKVISLRSPELIEEDGKMYQESEIFNISFLGESMEINYAGKHRRYLPPINRIRNYFTKYFGTDVRLIDAISLSEIPEDADSCKSTRYVVIARKS